MPEVPNWDLGELMKETRQALVELADHKYINLRFVDEKREVVLRYRDPASFSDNPNWRDREYLKLLDRLRKELAIWAESSGYDLWEEPR